MNVHIITIGDELLIGQVIDTNAAWMGQQLNLAGAKVIEKTSIGDEKKAILHTLHSVNKSAEVVLITGGLGPTKDDITKKVLAEFFETDMVFHQPTYERILRLFKQLGYTPTDAHRLQCYMPKSATLLYNKMGTAPGMWFEKDGKVYISMPGVPYEMKYVMEHGVIPRLKKRFPGNPLSHRTILTAGEGEARIAVRLETFAEQLPDNIKLAFLPNLGQVRLRLTGTGKDGDVLEKLLDQKKEALINEIPELVFGFEKETLEIAIGKLLREQNLTLCTAESCTGGYLAHKITSVPGSSDYFLGSTVAYSNEVKMKQLQVREDTLEKYGAVSEQTVEEMVSGAIRLFGSDLAVAISGIAGPGGGTVEKPVGTVCLAIGNNQQIQTIKMQYGKDRIKNIQLATTYALNMIRHFLAGSFSIKK